MPEPTDPTGTVSPYRHLPEPVRLDEVTTTHDTSSLALGAGRNWLAFAGGDVGGGSICDDGD